MQHTFKTEKGEFVISNDASVYDKDKFVCHWPDCTEEQAAMVVERDFIGGTPLIWYRNYKDRLPPSYSTAKESIASLMEREKIYTVNPLGDYYYESYPYTVDRPEGSQTFEQWEEYYKSLYANWQQAKERTSENWVILKIK